MTAVYLHTHRVTHDEIDQQGHVHNLRYLQWTLSAASKHSAASGWDAEAALQNGIGWVVRSHDITYRAAAMADDELLIQTWICDLNPIAIRRRAAIFRPADRRLLAKVETRWVLADLRAHKAIRLDAAILSSLQVVASPPQPPWHATQ